MTIIEQTATVSPGERRSVWHPVCALADLEPLWGEAALVGASQVALFRLPDDRLFAVDNADPHTGAFVMSRGIVGSRGATPTIASPLHKDVYDLETGACLTRPDGPRLATWQVRVTDGVVAVRSTRVLVAASHGTSDLAGRRAVAALVEAVRLARPEIDVRDSFVDVQEPSVPDVLGMQDDRATATVVPLLLSEGYHVHVDLADAARDAHIPVRVTGALGPDRRLAQVLARRLREAGVAVPGTGEERIVLAAAGSSDAGAVAACHVMGGMLAAELGRDVTVAFVSAAHPRVGDAVTALREAGAGPVAVSTYLLAPGYFADLIQQAGADVVSRPLLVTDAPPPPELVALVGERFDTLT
ncbi:nitrite reductase small subunit NirD [Microbacterium sp. NPDC089189]|uniref:nitrite reductase small subunit NirD n=1 Tax=Microbacterium sp. NPDC089189 TaxID=3154972 RepID=UPI00341CC2EB